MTGRPRQIPRRGRRRIRSKGRDDSMNKLERKAALAVAAAAAGVIVSGVSLIRKHTRYLAQKAAATFRPEDEDEELTREALAAGEEAEEREGGNEA